MNFEEYSKLSDKTAQYPHNTKDETLEYIVLCISGEAGEMANVVKKIIRDDDSVLTEDKLNHLIDELGDVMWYVARLLTKLGLPMSEVLERNLEKLSSRKERGTLGGSGDNR